MPRELLALRSAPPVVASAEAERIARDLYGLAVVATPLPGERDCNFQLRAADAREYVLKIFGDADALATDCQVAVLRHLAEQDPSLPVPRLLATLAGADLGRIECGEGGYATGVFDYLSGELLDSTAPTPALLQNLGSTLARVDRALQGFFHPALAQRIAWDVRRLPELLEHASCIDSERVRRRVADTAAGVGDRLTALRALRGQAIHGDFHAGNVLVDAAGAVCGILDFGDMIHAPAVLEAAVAISELLTQGLTSVDEVPAVLEGYSRVLPIEVGEADLLYDLVAGRHAATILLHAWRARHDPRGARMLEAAAAAAVQSLDDLLRIGRAEITRAWGAAAGLPSDSEPVDLDRRHRLMGCGAELFYQQPLHLVRGLGVWLYDAQGRPYLDVYNNVPHVGHCHPSVVRAVQRQTATLVTHTRYLHGRILDYADELAKRCPAPLDACLFVNSGSEANDVAWRIAQFATGQRGALVVAHAYHGVTHAAAALSPAAGQPDDPRVVTLHPPSAAWSAADELQNCDLTTVIEDTELAMRTLAARGFAPGALFIDSALTSSGIYDPPPAWLVAIVRRLRTAGCLIVADEVQFGLGRSGSHFWGFERRGLDRAGLWPDLVTLGKPIGNGYPMGVVIASRDLIEAFQARFGFFSTFGGNPAAADAGLAVLRVLERERLRDNARTTGEYLRERLRELAARHASFGRVRGRGLLLGLEVLDTGSCTAAKGARRIVDLLARQHRVLIGTEGPAGNILKLRPPMPFRPEHADILAKALDAAASDLEAELESSQARLG